jgi:hypothetical protein
MKRRVQLVVMCGFVLLCGSGAEQKGNKKEATPVVREWTIQHFTWELKDEKAIQAWKDKNDRRVPKDVAPVASIRLFRKDTEKSVAIVQLAKGSCGAMLLPMKDNMDTTTSVSFFYSSERFGAGSPDHVCGNEIDDAQLAAGRPISLGSSSHGIRNNKGKGYKSFTVKVTLVTVKKCDEKSAAAAFSEYVNRAPGNRNKE